MATSPVLLAALMAVACHGYVYHKYPAYTAVNYDRPVRPGLLPQVVVFPQQMSPQNIPNRVPQPMPMQSFTIHQAPSGVPPTFGQQQFPDPAAGGAAVPPDFAESSPGGTAAFVGQATGGLFANSQGFGANIPIPPLGGSVSLSGSTSLGIGQLVFPPTFGGSGSTGGGFGSGSVGPDGKPNSAAGSTADAKPGGVAFGTGLGVAVNLPVLGINQTFGNGFGFAVRDTK